MNVRLQGYGLAQRSSPLRTIVVAAAVATAILIIAAAWPVGGRAPSVLSSAIAEMPVRASPSGAIGASRDPSVPDAATALADRPIEAEGTPAPTF